jgi:CheY-like chemotaxis protein
MWGNGEVEVLPISEDDYVWISDPLERLLTYEAKWMPESPFFQNIFIRCPAELPPQVEARLIEICSAAYQAIGLRDFGRIDLRYYNGALKIILLDLKLPKVNGIEVLRKIKSDERTKKIPVVILTSSREDRDLKDAYDLGVNSYVTKPIKFDEFAKVVADLGMYWLLLNKSLTK